MAYANGWTLLLVISFWMNHVIHKSPADGHCLIYSLVTGIESMHPSWRISSQRILDALKQETISNMEMYIPFVDGASQESLINAMNAYVLHKIYNTLFGDNDPQIVANALGINIIIINKTEHLHNVSIVCPTAMVLLRQVNMYLSVSMVCIMMGCVERSVTGQVNSGVKHLSISCMWAVMQAPCVVMIRNLHVPAMIQLLMM